MNASQSSRIALVSLMAITVLQSHSFSQEESTPFDAAVVAFSDQEQIERILDWDGDGDQDAIGWWWTDDVYRTIRIQGYRNDSRGRLSPSWEARLSARRTAMHSAVGEFTGDDRDDLLLSTNRSQIHLIPGSGDSTPSIELVAEANGFMAGLAAGDFNADGLTDFASFDGSVHVYLNTGSGFTKSDTDCCVDVPSFRDDLLKSAAWDEQAGDDLILSLPGELTLLPVKNGVIGEPITWTHGIDANLHTVAGDVDGDRDVDIVLFGKSSSDWSKERYEILRQTRPGIFILEPPEVGGPATDFADVDGDGDLDGVCCGGGGGGPRLVSNDSYSPFQISINDGTGQFAPAFSIAGLGAHHLAGAQDLDADGDLDLVGGRCIYFSRGGIRKAPSQPLDLPFPGIVSDRALSDLEGDQDLDYNVGINTLAVNQGDGFAHPVGLSYEPPASPRSYVGPGFPGDFDGDGDVDLIVSRKHNGAFEQMQFLVNEGGRFVDGGAAGPPGVDFNVTSASIADHHKDRPDTAIVADGDGDGDLDLFVNQIPYGGLYVGWRMWHNDGTGYFDKSTRTGSQVAHVLAVADFSGDGLPDVIVQDWTSTSVVFGQGNGVFSPPVSIAPDLNLFADLDRVVAADLDRDGDVDLLAINGDQRATPYVFRNNGDGTFEQDAPIDGVTLAGTHRDGSLQRVFVHDINDDGRVDFLAGPTETIDDAFSFDRMGYAIYLQDRDGSFRFAVNQLVDGAALADMDGDGDPDLIGRSLTPGTRWHGPSAGSRRQYGQGVEGTGQVVPTLGATGPFRPGETLTLKLSGTVGGSFALLAVGAEETALTLQPHRPELLCYTFPWIVTHVMPTGGAESRAADGSVTWKVRISDDMPAAQLYHQCFVADAAAPHRIATTNGLELTYGEL